jgi:hypothetical protein
MQNSRTALEAKPGKRWGMVLEWIEWRLAFLACLHNLPHCAVRSAALLGIEKNDENQKPVPSFGSFGAAGDEVRYFCKI